MEIKIEQSAYSQKTLCRLCAMVFKPQFDLTPVVYDGGKRIGEVCDGCYPSDKQALRQRLRERAALLRTTAANMEANANGEIVMPTTDD